MLILLSFPSWGELEGQTCLINQSKISIMRKRKRKDGLISLKKINPLTNTSLLSLSFTVPTPTKQPSNRILLKFVFFCVCHLPGLEVEVSWEE